MKRRTNKTAPRKTINRLLKETFLQELKTSGLNDAEAAIWLEKFSARLSPKGNQPAPPNIVAMCEAMQQEATAEMECIVFRAELERRTARN